MEIDITEFYKHEHPQHYSASVAELGADAGKITWSRAIERARFTTMLNTSEKIEALREYAKGFGAWTDDEVDAWTDTECEALFIQRSP